MIYGSVCSGIEAASVAWHPLGWKAAWLAEIEPFPSAVLAHHYPDVPNLGDMTKIAAMVRAGTVAAPDVLVGGTPCQAFSIAGLRNSLDDARGQLSLEYVRLANEIDSTRSVHGLPSAVIVWENVPGVLSTKDNAFGCFLAGLAGEDDPLVPAGAKWSNAGCVYGPQRTVAWRILDAQYFGVAQRRRRVFVVASAREGFDPAAVLFEFDGLRRDITPRRETGQDVAAGTLRSTDGGSDVDNACAGHLITGTLQANGKAAGSATQQDAESGMLVALSVALRGRDGGATAELGDEVAGCLRASGGGGDKAHVLAFSCKDNGRDATIELSPTLRSMGHSGSHQNGGGQMAVAYAIQAGALRTNPNSSHRLDSQAYVPDVARCVATREGSSQDWETTTMIAHSLRGEEFDASEDGTGRGQPIVAAFAQNSRNELRYMNGDGAIVGALSAEPGMKQTCYAQVGMAVRRLTPRECERLQGFTDDYTRIPLRHYKQRRITKTRPAERWDQVEGGWVLMAADGPRYKALGNSFAVPVVRWIGERIQLVEELTNGSR